MGNGFFNHQGNVQNVETNRFIQYKKKGFECPDKIDLFSIYNILQYKSNEEVTVNGSNVNINNGLGEFYEFWDSGVSYVVSKLIRFGSPIKFYRVIIGTNAGESPDTHPEKYTIDNPALEKLRLITDAHVPLSARIGSENINLHTENFIVLNNQGETDFYNENIADKFSTVQNLNTADIFRDPDLIPKTEIKLFDDTGTDVLMEYLIIHFKKEVCQQGWLFIEIDEPEVTGTLLNDHFLYFWIWEGNVNKEDGVNKDVTIDNQFNQNVQGEKVGTLNPDINVLSNSHIDTEGNHFNRIQAVMRISEIQSGNDDKKLLVGLNTPIFAGVAEHYTIMIGLRPTDLKHKEKVEDLVHFDDVPIGDSGTIKRQCTNPGVGNITLKLSNYRVKLEKDTSKRWDDRPIPSHIDGAMNASGLIGKGVGGDNQLNVFGYLPFTLKADNDFTDFPSQTADHFGLPNRFKNSDINDFRAVARASSPGSNPQSKLAFGFEHFSINTNLVQGGEKLNRFSTSFNLGANSGLGIYHKGHENIPGNNSNLDGSIKMIGAFKKEFFGTLNDWIMRLPQFDTIAHGKALYGAPSNPSNFWKHIGWTNKNGFKIGIYRSDKFNLDVDNRINFRELRDNMVLIQEFNIEDLYSDPHVAETGTTDFPPDGDDGKIKAHYKVFTTVDMHLYININLNLGDDPNEPIAYFWLVFGSKTASTGFFFNDRNDTSGQSHDSGDTEDEFPYFEMYAIMRHLNASGPNVNPAATGPIIDFGTMLFKAPRFVDLTADSTPRDYVYDPDPNIDPF